MSKLFEIIFWALLACFFFKIGIPYLLFVLGLMCAIKAIMYIVNG